jgi:hypothetical protein
VTLFLASTFVKGFPVGRDNGVMFVTYAHKLFFQDGGKSPGGDFLQFVSV